MFPPARYKKTILVRGKLEHYITLSQLRLGVFILPKPPKGAKVKENTKVEYLY